MKKNTHGGKRQGAGRKPSGRKPLIQRNIYMPEHHWKKLDAIRGSVSRGAWVVGQLE